MYAVFFSFLFKTERWQSSNQQCSMKQLFQLQKRLPKCRHQRFLKHGKKGDFYFYFYFILFLFLFHFYFYFYFNFYSIFFLSKQNKTKLWQFAPYGCIQIPPACGTNILQGMYGKSLLPVSAIAMVTRKSFNGKFTAEINFSIGCFMLKF